MSLPIEVDALEPMEPALPLPKLPLVDEALLPGVPLAWLPLDEEPVAPGDPLAELPLDKAEPPLLAWVPPLVGDCLLGLPLCALLLLDDPMLPEPLEPMLPEPDTLGEPPLAGVPPGPFCVESLPMLLPVPSFNF